MTGPFFVDTNVLVYAKDETEPEKAQRANSWVLALATSRSGRLSYQVLVEYYSVVTRKLRLGRDPELARLDVIDLLSWRPVIVGSAVINRAWTLEDRFALSWWDCLIVAAAQQAGCAYLLTEDLQHGQKIDDVTVISPFEVEPDAILTA